MSARTGHPLETAAESRAGENLVLRPPAEVMRLARIGSFFQTRISFMRTLVRRMHREAWTIRRVRFDLDGNGYGTAVYEAATPHGIFSLVAFSDELAPEERTDRVIAEKWDATFALAGGAVDDAAIARLRRNVPRQEAGRCSAAELVLSRANKSVRLFEHVVDRLARGRQPELTQIGQVGYLMRTTAVYGNGKFGLADLPKLHEGPVLNLSFQAEMLSVYLTREFTFDLVEHIARQRSPATAVPLGSEMKRVLGIGNATGLGMAPFLFSHPILLHHWIWGRETAIARVRAVEAAEPPRVERFKELLGRAIRHVAEWHTDDARQGARIATLRRELDDVKQWLESNAEEFFAGGRPWNGIADWAAAKASMEMQELLNSLILEPYPELVDDLENGMRAAEEHGTEPQMSLTSLKDLIEANYGWALSIDFDDPEAQHFFWYVSEEKLEPRLGERGREPGAEREMRTGIARDVKALHQDLSADAGENPEENVAEFLLRRPRWRHMVRRVQSLARYPYAEIRDNLLGSDCVPIDLLRCKLSIFGASKFDPKSDRWVRITLFQGAPPAEELSRPDADDWAFPVVGG